MNKKPLLIILAIFLPFTSINAMVIYAHNFDTDDNSTFLTLVNKLLIENRLLNDSISINNYNNNSNSNEYIENTENILEDILISEDSFIIDSNQFYNNTIIALVVANLADEVLRNYGRTFGVPSNIMLSINFSNIININSQNKTNDSANMSNHNNHTIQQGNGTFATDDGNGNGTIVNNPSYLSALEHSDRMIQLYNNELNGTSGESVYINKAKSDLGNALYELKKAIALKESPYKIMEIVHGKVHPNLQIAFNLTLKR